MLLPEASQFEGCRNTCRISMITTSTFGSWRSPVTADVLVQDVVGLSFPVPGARLLYWIESRPREGGRQVIVCRDPGGVFREVIPEGFSARTTVHEYGGLCYAVHGDAVFFSNFADQRLYRIDGERPPRPVSPEPPSPAAYRYADPVVSPDGAWIVCVRERHEDEEVVNEIVAMAADGSAQPRVIVAGHDFFASPRLDPSGTRLAWISWDHPRMPWDGTELWESRVDEVLLPAEPRLVAGGPDESVTQPRYSPQGRLHFVSDRTGWWNLYTVEGDAHSELAPAEAEFAGPDWLFGQSSYAFLQDGGLVAKWSKAGLDHLGVLPPGDRQFQPVPCRFTSIDSLKPFGAGIVAVAGSADQPAAIVEISIPEGDSRLIKNSREAEIPRSYLSTPEPIEFPTGNGLSAHALFYPPRNPDYSAPVSQRPPLIVMCHGGPTSAASPLLNLGIQFWTSRGLAVVDVNYGGSTGFGRAYRQRLNGMWGVVDVDDCVNAARWLAEKRLVDQTRLVIRGGSAGGYTTLCALTFRDVFACGASHYGVADAAALATETHKFESRYLDTLIGPWPEARLLYEQRSPIFHTGLMHTPVILFQGLDDRIVPARQTEMMAAALRDNGVAFAYLAYEGEQHGFRKAENIRRTAEAELYFYGRILGFTPSDPIEPVPIENAPGLRI